MKARGVWGTILSSLFLVGALAPQTQAGTPSVIAVDISSTAEPANSSSDSASISGDGRWVAFSSQASNLVPSDTDYISDIFVKDLQTGLVELASVSSLGQKGNGYSYSPVISSDGRFVAFESDATNLVQADTNYQRDVFMHDRFTDTTRRVSISSLGQQSDGNSYDPAISADGRYVAFHSDATNLAFDNNLAWDVFVRDTQWDATQLVSSAADWTQGNSDSFSPSISADGRYVAFQSWANNIVPGDTNNTSDIFVADRVTGRRTLESKSSAKTQVSSSGVTVYFAGEEANAESYYPAISANGRYIVFSSRASNLVQDGDDNWTYDTFIRDRQTQITSRVSKPRLTVTAGPGGAQVSQPGITTGDSWPSWVSLDGRFVVFESHATNLVDGDTNGTVDVFMVDRVRESTTRISLSSSGGQANSYSYSATASSDARRIVFTSAATNLVVGDSSFDGIFLVDRLPPCPTGGQESGTVTSEIHEWGEPVVGPGPLGDSLHEANCQLASSGG